MTNQPLKVVLFGGVEGEFQTLVDKLTTVHNSKGGPFDHYFVLGNLFKEGDNEELIEKLLNGEFKFPAHTYFLLGDRALPEKVENLLKSNNNTLTENFEFLGNSGKLTLTSGLKIAYFSGSPQENVEESELKSHQYNVADIQKMIDTTESGSIDVLLTFDWPKGLLSQSKSSILPPPQPNSHLNSLIHHIKPKYHFASQLSTNFVELEPYTIEVNPTMSSLTRFYNIASTTNPNGDKWSYAMKISPDQPNQHLPESFPPNHTQSPLMGQDAVSKSTKRNFEVLEEDQPQANSHFFDNSGDQQQFKKAPKKGYVCKICNIEGHFIKDCPQKTQPKKTLYSTTDCWFCVSNEKCASHLIVSLGEELYLAMARGSLIDPKAPSTKIPGGGQLLIMPIPHTSTVGNFETQPESKGYKELAAFKKAIAEFYATYDCFPFYFETYRPAVNQHGLLQVFPVPNEVFETLDKSIDEAFNNESTDPTINFQPTLDSPFIRVEYKDVVKGASFPPRVKVPLYLGRQVLGKVLNCPDRIDWKKCEELTTEEETQFNKDFTAAFSKFDPYA